MRDLAKSRAGHLGGTACYEKYGRDHFSALGKLGGRPSLPTLAELRVEPASEGQIITGGEKATNGKNTNPGLTALKKLWKLQNQRRGSAAVTGSPKGG